MPKTKREVGDAEDLGALSNDQRAENDAYWTPNACALACTMAVQGQIGHISRVLEPAVGGGAWARAVRKLLPSDAKLVGVDVDPQAPGFEDVDVPIIGAFPGPYGKFDLVIGNPPYSGDLRGWIDESRKMAPNVAYLLRSTFLGSNTRSLWWIENPPSMIWTLSRRPKWEGPGRRKTGDKVDSVLVLWSEGNAETRHRWLRW